MYQKTYPTYLVHFNKNHDSKNGQFTYGDGDGDGISDDHGSRNGRKKGIPKGVKVAAGIAGLGLAAGTVYGIKKLVDLSQWTNLTDLEKEVILEGKEWFRNHGVNKPLKDPTAFLFDTKGIASGNWLMNPKYRKFF